MNIQGKSTGQGLESFKGRYMRDIVLVWNSLCRPFREVAIFTAENIRFLIHQPEHIRQYNRDATLFL